jgi:Fe2+ or Zn2+ uptake regulation protein
LNTKRDTVQRQIVVEVLKKFRTHPTVEEMYLEIHKNHPSISKATVYRNLYQLAEEGMIRHISPGDLNRFDGRMDQHYHFKCKNCGGISDIEFEYLAAIDEAVRQKYGIQADEHEVVFRGICTKCAETS